MNNQVSRRFVMAVALAGVLAACSQSDAPAKASSAPAAAKPMVVATNAAYAPFESMSASGQIEGFDADMVKAVAAKGGFEVKFANTPWEGIFKTLDTGESNLVVSAVTITDVRRQSMDFSEPYFDAVQLIAIRGDTKVASLQDVQTLVVGVQNGTTGDEVVSKLMGKTNPNIKRFESTPLALKELEAGGVGAVVADNGVVKHYIQNNAGAGIRLVSDNSFVPEQYGFVVKEGNAELLGKINAGLKGIRADGTYDKIYAKWFGSPTPVAAASSPASAASR